MRTQATVIKTENNLATVELHRKSACEGCHKAADGKGCSVCSLLGSNSKFSALAENPVGALVGDRVEVETSTGRVLFYAAAVFVFPVLAALLFWALSGLFLSELHWQVAFAGIGFVVSFAAVWIYSERIRKNKRDIVIVAILSPEDNG